MKVCDISVREFLSVRSVGLSGFSLALTSFFLGLEQFCVLFSGKISLRKGSCRTGFQCLCIIRLNLCIIKYIIVAELCTENYLLVFCFYFLE